MSKLLTTSKYLGYPINTTYQLKQSNMKEIYLALAHARDTIDRPIALRYTIGLDNNHSFDINKLTRKMKSLFKDGYSFIYSFEHAENRGLHLEMMLVVDQKVHNPISVFDLLKKVAFKLDGVRITDDTDRKVVSLNFHERKEDYIQSIGGSKVGHSLKDESQFIDCVYRASYLSKQDDKDNVQYKKKFGTTTG